MQLLIGGAWGWRWDGIVTSYGEGPESGLGLVLGIWSRGPQEAQRGTENTICRLAKWTSKIRNQLLPSLSARRNGARFITDSRSRDTKYLDAGKTAVGVHPQAGTHLRLVPSPVDAADLALDRPKAKEGGPGQRRARICGSFESGGASARP